MTPGSAYPIEAGMDDGPVGEDRRLWLRYRALKDMPDVTLHAEYSTDLTAWSTHVDGLPATEVVSREDHGDGTETVTLRLTPAVSAHARSFLRLRAILNE